MTKFCWIKDFHNNVGKEVEVRGWAYNFRSSGKIAFLQLRDGTAFTQGIAVHSEIPEEVWNKIQTVTLETSLIVKGIITKHPKKEEFELQVKDVEIVGTSPDYPISKKEHGPDFLLDNRHLWLRSSKQWAIQKVRDTIIHATYDWMRNNNFTKIDSPIFTPAACEGTTTLFEVEYFDLGKAYLSQSGQLYLEAAVMSLNRVFDFGPVFRAEKSKTRRHLIEFWMMDAEMAFCDHEENMKLQEDLICFIIAEVLKRNKTELAVLERDISFLENIQKPFLKITHKEAIEKLQKMGSKITFGDDLGAEDETLLTEKLDKPIFIEKYPIKVKAFYMKRNPKDPTIAMCSDLLAPEGYGEIIGGSQREENIDILKSSIKEFGLPESAFSWYLDLRKYGSVPHSGFGYGLERLTGWICGIRHIRETIPFPRLLNRNTP